MAEKVTTKPKGGYGKRPLSFWIVLYVVIGGVIYATAYLLLMHHGSSGGGSLSY
jgi:uncharacterized membrane-anchored protein YitT (DUF2179 family)